MHTIEPVITTGNIVGTIWFLTFVISNIMFECWTKPMYKPMSYYYMDPNGYQLGELILTCIPLLNLFWGVENIVEHYRLKKRDRGRNFIDMDDTLSIYFKEEEMRRKKCEELSKKAWDEI